MIGAHLEQVAPYHWRLRGRYTVDLKRDGTRWLVLPTDPEHAGGPGNWGTVGEALAHAYGLATRDTFDTFRPSHPERLSACAPP